MSVYGSRAALLLINSLNKNIDDKQNLYVSQGRGYNKFNK